MFKIHTIKNNRVLLIIIINLKINLIKNNKLKKVDKLNSNLIKSKLLLNNIYYNNNNNKMSKNKTWKPKVIEV